MRCTDQSDHGVASSLPPVLHASVHFTYTFDLSSNRGCATSHAAVAIILNDVSVHKQSYVYKMPRGGENSAVVVAFILYSSQ
jgi:hypothetical protein